jgi:hypothetical protein
VKKRIGRERARRASVLMCFLAASVELLNARFAAARKCAREKKPASTKRA